MIKTIYTYSLSPSSLDLYLSLHKSSTQPYAAHYRRDNGSEKLLILSPLLRWVWKNSLRKPSSNTNVAKPRLVYKLILSPLLRWVWKKLSSQTQLEYKRGFPAIGIQAHSLSPSSLGLEKTLFANPARIQTRVYRDMYSGRQSTVLILSLLLRWV